VIENAEELRYREVTCSLATFSAEIKISHLLGHRFLQLLRQLSLAPADARAAHLPLLTFGG